MACYYGCLLTRPPEIVAFDNAENPTCMDNLVAAMDAEPVVWPYKTECCGASLSITQGKVVNRLGRKLLEMARAGRHLPASSSPARYAKSISTCGSRTPPRRGRAHPRNTGPLYYHSWGLPWGCRAKDLGLSA